MRTRILTILLPCGLLLSLLYSADLSLANAADTSPDLAALVVRPADLEAAGFAEMVIHRSLLADRPRQAAEFTEDFNAWFGTDMPTGTAIRRANPELTYIQHLAGRTSRVVITLMAYSSEHSAQRGMDAYVGSLEGWYGDEPSAFELDGVDAAARFESDPPEKKHPFETIVFRVDAITVVVQVHNQYEGRGTQADSVAPLQRDRLTEGRSTAVSVRASHLNHFRIHGRDQRNTSRIAMVDNAIPRFEEFTNPHRHRGSVRAGYRFQLDKPVGVESPLGVQTRNTPLSR